MKKSPQMFVQLIVFNNYTIILFLSVLIKHNILTFFRNDINNIILFTFAAGIACIYVYQYNNMLFLWYTYINKLQITIIQYSLRIL